MGLFNSIRMGSSAAGDYEVKRSLRFNDGDSPYLQFTPSSTGNRKTWTWSSWVKRSNISLGSQATIFHSYGSGSQRTELTFETDDTLRFAQGTASDNGKVTTTAKFRDVNAWYHIVCVADFSNGTAGNRFKLYVNGVEQANTINVAFTDADGQMPTSSVPIEIGGRTSNRFFDGYLAEINFIDGTALTPSSFAETDADTGEYKPKKYAGSYGTNGFYLNFSDNSGTSATTLGRDSSGNGHNFTPNNFAVSDSIPDTPTNNFCTLNPLNATNDVTLTEGNLEFFQSSNDESATATFAITSGKWYWEVYKNSSENPELGIDVVTRVLSNKTDDVSPTKVCIRTNGGDQQVGTGTPTSITGSSGGLTGAGVVAIAVDFDNKKIWYSDTSGNFFNSGNPASGSNEAFTFSSVAVADECVPYFFCGTGGNNSFNINFGQDGTFAGNTTAGGYADGNGHGNFKYSVPSGFLALCSANLSDPSIAFPNQHFDTLLYTGNGSSQTISGLNFQPDWVWIKRREGENQFLTDSIRGAGVHLRSDQTIAESDNSDGFTSFTSDGFTLTGSGAAEPQINANGGTFVAWNWKGAGSTASNSDGSITTSVRANTTAGFSILTYTGNGSSGATIGHGLGVAPDVVIIKRRDGSNSWQVFHQYLGAGKFTDISSSSVAETNSNRWNDTAPTSSVITLGNNSNVNSNNGTCVGYVFSEVAGYSKFGSYTGNGNANGTFVFTGFRPALVVTKIIDTMSENWTMSDNKRSPRNPVDLFSRPDETTGDTTGAAKMDFLSNGFKLRNTDDKTNKNGANYIYMAFAESPFKYSRAR